MRLPDQPREQLVRAERGVHAEVVVRVVLVVGGRAKDRRHVEPADAQFRQVFQPLADPFQVASRHLRAAAGPVSPTQAVPARVVRGIAVAEAIGEDLVEGHAVQPRRLADEVGRAEVGELERRRLVLARHGPVLAQPPHRPPGAQAKAIAHPPRRRRDRRRPVVAGAVAAVTLHLHGDLGLARPGVAIGGDDRRRHQVPRGGMQRHPQMVCVQRVGGGAMVLVEQRGEVHPSCG